MVCENRTGETHCQSKSLPRGGGGANEGELSEGVGGPFGRLTLCNIATDQAVRDGTHSEAQDFKEDANWCANNAPSEAPVMGGRRGGVRHEGQRSMPVGTPAGT